MQTMPITEAEVRELRDQVYIQPSTDKNWEACRDAWMTPENVQWLRERCPARKS